MLFSRVFRVLSDSLRDRGVDFLTVNIDEKSCYFRVFFACFLTDCKTGVLIFSCYAERRVLVVLERPYVLDVVFLGPRFCPPSSFWSCS